MFERLRQVGEGAFVPFLVAGDPDAETSLEAMLALADAGADALEVGLPFSDPVADGPVIQRADTRALAAGTRTGNAFELLAAVRRLRPELPIGLLVYANLVEARGLDCFYADAAAAGIDSVLVADAPTIEARPFAAAARRAGVAPVLMAAPTSTRKHLSTVAELGAAYTYVVTRAGVTGADQTARTDHRTLLARLRKLGAPPALLGFGISTPEQVRAALAAGAAGAISGSAVVALVEAHLADRPAMLAALTAFCTVMKAATRRESVPGRPAPVVTR
jgi:tryptophan synthase alpha chain